MDLEENSDMELMENDFEEEEEDDIENSTFSTEVCVICTGLVTDRGVIDSCDHWFCYECIEQWAEFANHCPTCKLVFSSITFSPIDESTDSFEGDESSLSIDDDSLYLPANFINEENVKCLEGEVCKIRNGLVEFGDFTTDTSVACDSCENWYHAICVNFDPNCEYEGGWICPSCSVIPSKISPKSNSEIETISATSAPQFGGNIFVSIDDGETAVVVSFHKDPHDTEKLDNSSVNKAILSDFEKMGKSSEDKAFLSDFENFGKSSENKAILSDFAQLSPIREIESIEEFEKKEGIKTEDDINMADVIETKEYKEENLVVEKSDEIVERPTNADLSKKSKRRDTQMMMEPIPVSKKSKTLNTDIMSIITERIPHKKENNLGARTKKIIKKPSELIVQELQTEIKTLKNSVNDEKLLTAFRSVIAPNKSGPRAKLSFSQNGKRKNLMKKIYSNSSGRRKAFWERDCEVEFWKNKCNSKVNQEKIETLQNILELLKNGPKSLESKEKGQGQNGEKKDSILSRVYLADSSIFPRKDDGLKPLSLIGESSLIEKNDGKKLENCDKSGVSSVKNENKSKNASLSSNLKGARKENKLTCEIKTDKKKWALEILARKNASSLEANKGKNEDLSSLKAKYPLLAQLPIDMKPELAPSQRNKIPLAVRQAQLYRVTEHFLRKANVPIIKRTAETELAVADSINIEKEICDKSNSKIVYLNLISQSIRQNTLKEKTENKEMIENRAEISEKCEKVTENNEISERRDVEELLRMAGLSSDSPPNSPNDQNALLDRGMIERNDQNALLDTDMIERNDQNALLQRAEVQIEENVERAQETIESNVENALKMAGFSSDNSNENCPKRQDKPALERENVEREKMDQKISSNVPSIGPCEIKPSDGISGNFNGSETSKNIIIDKNRNRRNKNIVSKREKEENCESESESCAESRSNSHKKREPVNQKLHDLAISISKKVEAYVKEHLRPLCKSGVINVGQYRWAVAKTTEKVMKFHHKEKNANFLIKEGEKVKKLADQYVEQAAQQKGEL